METRYDHNEEEKIYEAWEKSGLFNPDTAISEKVADPKKEPFSMVLPPPNVTGNLHIGHAFEHSLQDIIVRYMRMQGRPTLWVPGTDHAAIATQAKMEKMLQKEGTSKYDLGREEFLKKVNSFAAESHDTIVKQMRRLGASLDWSREAYTLDEKRSFSVRTAFKKMYDLGLIYRGERVINWDPKAQTVISDDEIVYEERTAKLYTFRYSKDFPISISTTRPETKLGDTAVAVHPDDQRYKEYVGKEYDAIFCGVPLKIKIIADKSVDKEFGTGALGVTPAHSIADWEMAVKHNLPLVRVIDERAKMMVGNENIIGKKTTEAREAVVEWLREENLLEKEEEISQNVSTAERTGAIIEPLPKLQWFVGVDREFVLENSKIEGIPSGSKTTLKKIMWHTVESGQIKIAPEHFEKIYFNWIDNLRDWCISRQLWFGHRIPAWYQNGESDIYIGQNPPEENGWVQDEDTFDTWFSSGMWPFSTLGWPSFAEASEGRPSEEDKPSDLKRFFPNSLMNPGYEILFLWVARMILMSGCLLGEIPFKNVSIHGIVRDKNGQKFSKSLGNGVDPLELANTYGADAVRMALIAGAAPGSDVKFDENRVRGYRNFTTKIWNAARFVLANKPDKFDSKNLKLQSEDEELLDEFQKIKREIGEHIENMDLHLGVEKIYHYFWHTFADVVIESMKSRLKGDGEDKNSAYFVLEKILLDSLKILHPFMPFVTEKIYQLFKPDKILMVEKWDG